MKLLKQDLIPVFAFVLAVAGAGQVCGQTITTNLLPVADSFLRDNLPDSNFGAAQSLPMGVGNNGSPHNRGLFRFDLSVIPANAVVTTGTLYLIVVQDLRPPSDFNISRLLTNWVEGEVTWNDRATGSPWSVGGALSGVDYLSTPSASGTLDIAATTNALSGSGMTADLQSWVSNPSSNFGWIVSAVGELPGSGKQVGSRENPGYEPVLQIQYTLPLAPTVLTVLPPTNGLFRFSFNLQTGHGYVLQYIGNLADSNWNSFLVLDPAPAPQEAVIQQPFTPTNRFYRVRVN